jgi:iron complex transport system ATP-binding protein
MPPPTHRKMRPLRAKIRHRPDILQVDDLIVRRGATTILRDVTWTIRSGEHWVVLGPNGSGKTSLLKALTGFLSPTAGVITVLGRRYGASDWRDLRLQIGVVTSAFVASIPPAETAIETVLSGKFAQLDLWAKFTSSDEVEAHRRLRQVSAGGLSKRPWLHLSQGERQRVLIARALMAKPKLLILDEPCAGLDPVAREAFLKLVSKIAGQRGLRVPAIVLVTHHVEEIARFFTHALLLSGGRVAAAGPKRTLLTSSHLTAAFGAKMHLSQKAGRYTLGLVSA